LKGSHKNKPTRKQFPEDIDYIFAWECWAETQEAELRKKLNQLVKERGSSSYGTQRIALLKEILGE